MSPKASSLAAAFALALVVGCDDSSDSPTQPATTVPKTTTPSGGGTSVTPPVTPVQTDPVVVAHDTGEWNGTSAKGTDLYVHIVEKAGNDEIMIPVVGDASILVYSCKGDLTFLRYPAGTYKARFDGACKLVSVDNNGAASTIAGSTTSVDTLYTVASYSRGAWTWTWDGETFSMR